MLPSPPPPPQLVLQVLGHPSAPSVSPSATPPSSVGSSIAIVILVVIATVFVTCAIVVLRRSCRHRHRLSCSSLSPRRSFSPTASSPPPPPEPEMLRAAAAVSAGGVPSKSSMEMAVVSSAPRDGDRAPPGVSWLTARSAEEPVKGTELVVAPSSAPVPSAPSLPEVERVILDLLSLPPAPMSPGGSSVCSICNQEFLRTDVLLVLPVCSHAFHRPCIVASLRRAPIPSRCPFCHAYVTIPFFPVTTKSAPSFSSDECDVEAQMPMPAAAPAPPGEEVAAAVGGSRGWLRSSMDRLSGRWRGCSGDDATAVSVPPVVSPQHPTGSWNVADSGHIDVNSYGMLPQMQWVFQQPLSGGWSEPSSSRSTSTAVALPVVLSQPTAGSLSLDSAERASTDSRGWDQEAAAPTPQRASALGFVRWLTKK